MAGGVYIPKRIYDMLKCIYTERIVVVSAPSGYGKSTMLREFVRRSRPDGFSCRFITESKTTVECFNRMTEMLFGSTLPVPITNEERAALQKRFSGLCLQKPLLLVLDCPAAQTLFGNEQGLSLFLHCEGLHIVFVCEDNSYYRDMLAAQLGIRSIIKQELALTEDETAEYFSRCNAVGLNAALACAKTGGMIFALRLCVQLHLSGKAIRSYEINRLIIAGVIDGASRMQQLALLCATYCGIDDMMCKLICDEKSVAEYFGAQYAQSDMLCGALAELNGTMPLVSMNYKTGRHRSHLLLIYALNRYITVLPSDVRRGLHICFARYYQHRKDMYYAFLQYVLAKEYASAAALISERMFSFNRLMYTKEILFKFALECPLDCKPILPKLVRTLALLMLTPYKERVKFRFDEVIAHVAASQAYTEKERSDLLAYIHALRTYQDFYAVDKMGNHIKRAYDYFSGNVKQRPPFYSWTLYTPSIFALVHRYSIPLSTEREQFVRYQKMYTEMIGHGAFVDRLYLAEEAYVCGSFALSKERSQAILAECSDVTHCPAVLIALTITARCCILLGEYEEYKSCETAIAKLMRRYSSTELDDMGALCLAMLGVLKCGDAYIGYIATEIDTKLLANRYSAPFCFYMRCAYMLKNKDYLRLLTRKDYFLAAAEDVGSETMALKIKMCAAAAMLRTGEKQRAADTMRSVIDVLCGSEVIMPAVELCLNVPDLFSFTSAALGGHYSDYINKVTSFTRPLRRTIDVFRTRELTELGRNTSRADAINCELQRICDEICDRKKLKLTEKALKYAVLAAARHSNDEIAEICGTTADSVKSSLKRTYSRLGIRSRAQLKYALGLQDHLRKI